VQPVKTETPHQKFSVEFNFSSKGETSRLLDTYLVRVV